MPELPDLEVIRAYLDPRLAGVAISEADVRRPIVVRNLLGGEVAERLDGRTFTGAARRGKFLLLPLDNGTTVIVNPMLNGRFRYGEPLRRERIRDSLVITLTDGRELRYHDASDMGKVYLTDDLSKVPAFDGQGPDADDPALTLDLFRERLRRHTGEIKGQRLRR
jgi:formamidopyrimidine-DNA glycosylase